jgi:hypothetical protein
MYLVAQHTKSQKLLIEKMRFVESALSTPSSQSPLHSLVSVVELIKHRLEPLQQNVSYIMMTQGDWHNIDSKV